MSISQVQGLFWTSLTSAMIFKIFTNHTSLNDPKQLKNLIYKVKWRSNSLLHLSKNSHKTGKIPVLGKPTHMILTPLIIKNVT